MHDSRGQRRRTEPTGGFSPCASSTTGRSIPARYWTRAAATVRSRSGAAHVGQEQSQDHAVLDVRGSRSEWWRRQTPTSEAVDPPSRDWWSRRSRDLSRGTRDQRRIFPVTRCQCHGSVRDRLLDVGPNCCSPTTPTRRPNSVPPAMMRHDATPEATSTHGEANADRPAPRSRPSRPEPSRDASDDQVRPAASRPSSPDRAGDGHSDVGVRVYPGLAPRRSSPLSAPG